MRILQPPDWSKPRGFSHGVTVDGPGRWIVLAGQTGGDDKGEYPSDMAGQVAVALRRIVRLLEEAGAGKNFPPSTLLYIGGLVDARAKVEIEVTAFVSTA